VLGVRLTVLAPIVLVVVLRNTLYWAPPLLLLLTEQCKVNSLSESVRVLLYGCTVSALVFPGVGAESGHAESGAVCCSIVATVACCCWHVERQAYDVRHSLVILP
jgi:hypothetical protein